MGGQVPMPNVPAPADQRFSVAWSKESVLVEKGEPLEIGMGGLLGPIRDYPYRSLA